jgi:2'-hydroxyisoflavone reductase
VRLLVLGGTSFVGRHIVDAALAGGHDVTLFNRGRSNPGLFEQCERRVGDRQTGDYASLAVGSWDAVIDVNAYWPRAVREVAAAVGPRVGHYTFISTCSVYDSPGDGPVDESHPLKGAEDPDTETVTNETYGGLKVLCEREAAAAFGGRCTVIRPGLVAGPFDPTDRFTYWVRRLARGGVVAAPSRPDQPVQVVHARDQGDFVVQATVDGRDGPFNTVGPSTPLTLGGLLNGAGADVEVEWIDEAFLRERRVRFPLHLPRGLGADGLFRCSSDRATAAGFRNRPIEETVADTRTWDQGRDQDEPLAEGPSAEQEAALVDEWRAR